MASHPENTLAAFRQAVADGADAVETDLHVTRDGAFVCLHDGTLERTTDGRGRVEATALADLRALRAGGHGGAERVPTLAEFVGAVPRPVILLFELKSRLFRRADVCSALATEFDRTGCRDRSAVLSFDAGRLRAFRAVAPDIPLGHLSLFRFLPLSAVELVGPLWPMLLNPWFLRAARRRGQVVCPLDPHPDARLAWYRRLGCQAVLSNDPPRTRRLLAG
jgi:glycerophosphoryl diester phosphodiesterase